MDYEKKYKEAIEKLRSLHDDYDTVSTLIDIKEELEHIFPELKIDEDERIKREIVELIMQPTWKTEKEFHRRKELVTWLEKQGKNNNVRLVEEIKRRRELFLSEKKKALSQSEKLSLGARIAMLDELLAFENNEQKPVDKVEPKFKVGKWYQCTKDFFGKGVTFDKNTAYYCAKEGCLQNEYGCHIAIVKNLYDNFKLWTIRDAKYGDVLSNGKMIVIFKHFEEPSYRQHIVACIGLDTKGYIQITDDSWILGIDKAKPATKVQRDFLFRKIKEAGYKWDAEKKELKKIEQQSAWSEEDEKHIDSLLERLEGMCKKGATFTKTRFAISQDMEWLKSIKDRVQPNQWNP